MMIELCEICGKKAREEPVWYSIDCYYFCRKHSREVLKEVAIKSLKYPTNIQNAKPNTKEWHTLCILNEKAVGKFVKTYTQKEAR